MYLLWDMYLLLYMGLEPILIRSYINACIFFDTKQW